MNAIESPANTDRGLPTATPLLSKSMSRAVMICAFLVPVVFQLFYLAWTRNGIGRFSDPHSEADTVRSADAYAKDGLFSHHGLPRILYGNRFPGIGTVKDHVDTNGLVPPQFRNGFPDNLASHDEWVYTHYPPGPNLLCGLMARIVGINRVWALRLLPLALGLLATAIFFRSLARVFGMDRGALIAAGCVLLPLFNTHMSGLHFQGYAFAALLVQLSLLLELFWNSSRFQLRHGLGLFALGFVQGWLSFDLCFVVTFAAVPLWLFSRTKNSGPPWSWLLWTVMTTGTGFVAAHGLHVWQDAAELGGLHAALKELGGTAAERLGATRHVTYLGFLKEGLRLYVREFSRLAGIQFGPFVFLAFLAACLTLAFPVTRIAFRRATKTAAPVSLTLSCGDRRQETVALVAAFLISLVWVFLMPNDVVGNSHITLRQFFLFYFCLLLTVARNVTRQLPASPAAAESGSPAA